MPDILTPAERAAIAAFPEGRVQRIPRGVSGEMTYTWDYTRPGSLHTRLSPEQPAGWKAEAGKFARARAKHHRHMLFAREKRRESVAELHRAGTSAERIAVLVGASTTSVFNDLKALRERGAV